MPSDFETGTFVKDAGGTNGAVDIINLQGTFTPKIIMMYCNARTGVGAADGNITNGMGISNGVTEICVGSAVQDNVPTSNSVREQSANAIVIPVSNSAAVIGNITNLGGGTFSVTWTVNPTSSGFVIGFCAVGGPDIVNSVGGNAAHANNGTVDAVISFTPLAFQPDFMIWMEADGNAVPASGNGACISFGCADAAGNQFAWAVTDFDNQATTIAKRMFQSNLCNINMSFTGVTIRENEFLQFTANGWDWIQRKPDPATNRRFLYFAVQGGDWEVVNGTTRLTPGTKSYPTVNPPGGVILSGVNGPVTVGIQSGGFFTAGAMDRVRQHSFMNANNDNVPTSECGSSHVITGVHETTLGAVAAGPPIVDGLAKRSSFGVNAFVLRWDDPDSQLNEFGAMVFGGIVGGGVGPSSVLSAKGQLLG